MQAPSTSSPTYRRLDLVRCDGCGSAQIASSHQAVCKTCNGVDFHRFAPRETTRGPQL